MIGNLFALVLLLLLVDSGYSVEEDSTTEKCLSPDASVCQNYGKDCLQKLYNVEPCSKSVNYPDLYEGRLDADFTIKMNDGRKGKFLIAVYSPAQDSFTGIVEDCCGIEVGKKCTLRPKGKGESFAIIYLDDKKSCYWNIQEFPNVDSWCDEKRKNRPCLELNESGKVVIYQEWAETNIGDLKQSYKTDYCFFDMVPEDFARNGTKRSDGLLHIDGQRKPPSRIAGVNESCFKRKSDEVDPNTYWKNLKKTYTKGYTMCYYAVKFPDRLYCYPPPKPKELDDQKNNSMRTFWMTILGVVAISVVTICAVFALWFCRKSFPSFRKTEKQISDTLKNIESGENLLEDDDQNLDEKKNEVHETPDEIIFKDEIIIEGQAEDDEVTPMLPEQPQTYSNFDETIDAGCDRGFSSSLLPALRGNIKDGYTEKWAGVEENRGSWHDQNSEETHSSRDSANDSKQHPSPCDSGFDVRGNKKTAIYQNSDEAHSFMDNGNDPIQSPSSVDSGFGVRGDESVSSDQNSDEEHISVGSGKDPTVKLVDSGFDVRGVEKALHDQNSDGEHISVDREKEPSQLPVDSGFDPRGDEKATHEAHISVGNEKEPSQFSFHVDGGFDLCGENPDGVEEVFVKSNLGEYTKKSFLSDNGTGHANPCLGTFDGYVQKAIA